MANRLLPLIVLLALVLVACASTTPSIDPLAFEDTADVPSGDGLATTTSVADGGKEDTEPPLIVEIDEIVSVALPTSAGGWPHALPDGSYIYRDSIVEDPAPVLFSVGDPHNPTVFDGLDHFIASSANGERLLFMNTGSDGWSVEFIMVDRPTRQRQVIPWTLFTAQGLPRYSVFLSPTGNQLATYEYETDTSEQPRLVFVDVETGESTTAPGPLFPGSAEPAWSEDGSKFAAVTSNGVAILDMTSFTQQIIPVGGQIDDLAFSPDGSKLAFVSYRDARLTPEELEAFQDTEPAEFQPEHAVFVIELDGSEVSGDATQLTEYSRPPLRLTWTAGGNQILAETVRYIPEGSGLKVIDVGSGDIQEVTFTIPGDDQHEAYSYGHAPIRRNSDGAVLLWIVRESVETNTWSIQALSEAE